MNSFSKVFVILMLILFIVPPIFGRSLIPLDRKLEVASNIVRDHVPIPEFPHFPKSPSGWDVLTSFFPWLFDVFSWAFDFVAWLFTDVILISDLLRLFLLNEVPILYS